MVTYSYSAIKSSENTYFLWTCSYAIQLIHEIYTDMIYLYLNIHIRLNDQIRNGNTGDYETASILYKTEPVCK